MLNNSMFLLVSVLSIVPRQTFGYKTFNKSEINLIIFHSQFLSYIRGVKTVKWSTMFAVRCMFIWIWNTLMTARCFSSRPEAKPIRFLR